MAPPICSRVCNNKIQVPSNMSQASHCVSKNNYYIGICSSQPVIYGHNFVRSLHLKVGHYSNSNHCHQAVLDPCWRDRNSNSDNFMKFTFCLLNLLPVKFHVFQNLIEWIFDVRDAMNCLFCHSHLFLSDKNILTSKVRLEYWRWVIHIV